MLARMFRHTHVLTLFVGIFAVTMTAHTVSDKHGIGAFWHVLPFVTGVCVIKAALGSINPLLGSPRFAALRVFGMMYMVVVTALVLEGKPLAVAFTLPCLTATIKTGWHHVNCRLWGLH